MARTLTFDTLASSTQRLGSEPIVIAAVEWTSGTKYYSDKTFVLGTLNVEGRITSFGTISSKLNDRTYGTVDIANVTLCDIDSDLKTIFDSEIIEKIPVTIYQHFQGNLQADLAVILVGKVMSPIVWSEGERTLSFEIGNDWDSKDLLLEIKETSDDFPSEDDIGTVFPLCFGTVLRLPGVRVNRGKTGELLTPIYSWTTWYSPSNDPTKSKLTFKKDTFEVSGFEGSIGEPLVLEIGGCLFGGSFTTDTKFVCSSIGQFNVNWYTGIGIINRKENDADYDNASCAWVSGLGAYDLKGKYVQVRFMVRANCLEYNDENGVAKQDLIDNESYSTLNDAENGSSIEITKSYAMESFVAQVSDQDNFNNKIYFSRECIDSYGRRVLLGGGYGETTGEGAQIQQVKGQIEYEWEQLPAPDSSPLRWDIGPGADVKVHDAPPDLYVFNSVASEDTWFLAGQPVPAGTPGAILSPGIFEVAAKMDGSLFLLPESVYVINLANVLDVNGIMETLTTIHLVYDITQDGWDDSTIYASLHSSIHSNTATDVINWIALNRTSLVPNTVNFAAIGALIENYPSHFAFLSQRDALDGIQEIAWLARVGVFIDAGGLFLHYLAKQPTTYVFEAEAANIRFKSMSITKTSSDDIYTKFTSIWNFTYAETIRKKIKSENNVAIYGEEDFEITNVIYNIKSLVQKCHDFWVGRKSNCWYTIEINTFLYSLNVQMWDAVLVNVPYINGGTPIIGHVISIGHDSDTHQIVLTIWLPLKHGDGEAYQDDSTDVKPSDPGLLLETLDYGISKNRPNKKVFPGLLKSGRSKNKDAPISDYQLAINDFMNTLEYNSYHARVLEVFGDYLKCQLIDSTGFNSVAVDYSIKNNILEQSGIIYVAMPVAIRESTWKDKTFDNMQLVRTDPNDPEKQYTKRLSVLFERVLDHIDERWARPQGDTNYDAEFQSITPSYVAQDAPAYLKGANPSIIVVKYCPKGTGIVSVGKGIGKIVWQEESTREYATIGNDEPEEE